MNHSEIVSFLWGVADLILAGDEERIALPGVVRSVYDPCCGSGGMLMIAKEHVTNGMSSNGKLLRPAINAQADIHLFGQEVNPETWAVSKSDIFMKDPTGRDADSIAFGSTLSNDRHAGRNFDYLIANPPCGKDREAFLAELPTAAAKADLKLSAPVNKAILTALAERDETAAVCRSKDGRSRTRPGTARHRARAPCRRGGCCRRQWNSGKRPYVLRARGQAPRSRRLDRHKEVRPKGRQCGLGRLQDQLQPLLLRVQAAPPVGRDPSRYSRNRNGHHPNAARSDRPNAEFVRVDLPGNV